MPNLLSNQQLKQNNVAMRLVGDILTITVDLSQELGNSASGKSVVIASSQGNQPTGHANGSVIGLNIYRKV